MRTFVQNISKYAKNKKPNFLIISQNGEELLVEENYIKALDAFDYFENLESVVTR